MTTVVTVEDIAQMNKTEIAVQNFQEMMRLNWNFPFDETLAESQTEQWDNSAVQRAVSQAAKIIEACKE
jgi:hypothetical protein